MNKPCSARKIIIEIDPFVLNIKLLTIFICAVCLLQIIRSAFAIFCSGCCAEYQFRVMNI